MEKGILQITKTKKGYACKILFTNKKGKSAVLHVNIKFEDDKLNNKECLFETNQNGQLLKLVVDGKQILSENKVPQKDNEMKAQNKAINIWGSNNLYLRLPKDTSEVINVTDIDNFDLKLNKAVHFVNVDKGYLKDPEFTDEKMIYMSEFDDKSEKKNKKDKTKYLKRFEIEHNFDKNFIKTISDKQKSLLSNFEEGYKKEIQLTTSWRMALGLGNENVYETSMSLHHIYGIPYIPASSIKGVVRSWIITQYFGNPNLKDKEGVEIVPTNQKNFPTVNAEFRAFKNEMFCKFFGCPKETKEVNFNENNEPDFKIIKKGDKETSEFRFKNPVKTALETEYQGEIIFFDAFPTTEPKLEIDVMNPHYNEYYKDSDNKKNIAPTDFQKLVPVFFLTVANTSFNFMLASKKDKLENYRIGDKNIIQWLEDALTNHGIGAKTAVGYGYFNEI